MPTHPQDPNEFQTWANDVSARLRAIERRLQRVPDNPLLQTYENGDPLGNTLHLDFMEGLNAVLVGDGYVEVTCDCAGGVSTSVVVDEQSANKTGDNNDTITVTFATDGPAIVAGHLLVAHVVCLDAQPGTLTLNTPAGWTKAVDHTVLLGVEAFFYRIADGTETSVSFSATIGGSPPDGFEGFAVKIIRLVGFDPVSPINATSTTAMSGNLTAGDNYIVDGVVTTVSNCLVLYGTANRTTAGTSISWLGIGELYDFIADIAGTDASISCASKVHPDASGTGSILTIVDQGGNTWGVCMAIAPGTGGL